MASLPFRVSVGDAMDLMNQSIKNYAERHNKNNSNKKTSSSSSKKTSSSSSKKKTSSSSNKSTYNASQSIMWTGNKGTKKAQKPSASEWIATQTYQAVEKQLQNKLNNTTDRRARAGYIYQLQQLKDKANSTLPGGIAGAKQRQKDYEAATQKKESRERAERQSRIDELNDKLRKTTDRRARAAYRSEIKELQYPLSRADQRQGYLTRDKIRDAKAAYDEGTQLIKDGFEEEGKKLQEAAHNAAEYYRALAGYSGGASGADRILPELTPMENRIFTQEGKTALRAAKSLYELGQKTGDDALMEQARQMGYNVRLTEEYKDPDAVYAERSKEPITKRVDSHGRPIYTPTEIEAEGMASFFPAVGYQIKGSIEALLEAARGATRETIQNRNNDTYQANQDNLAYWQRKARTAQTEEQKAQAEKNIQNLQELLDSQRAKVETPTWTSSNALFDLHQAARLQELVQDSIRNPFGKLVNQAAMSALQMAPALAASAVGGPAVGAALMGAQAAGAKAGEVLESGGSATEALTRGLISGGIEGVTERIPIGNLLRIVRGSGGASFLANMARQAGIEATEESASYTLNYLADLAARDPNAQFSLQDLAESAAVGAISGAGFGGFGSGLSAGLSARQNTNGQQAAQNQMRGVTRQTGTGAERLATQRAAQQVTQQTQQPTTQQAENPLLRSMQETRQEQERAAVQQNLETQAEQITQEANAQVETIRRQAARRPQSAQERVRQAAQAEAQARRPSTLEEREADYQRRYQNYMQRAQEAATNPALQTPENYQALRNELTEIESEYNSLLQERRVQTGQVSRNYANPENHIDNRNLADMGSRSVKAFQFDYPQLHPYYAQAAQALMDDANWSLETQSNQKGRGTVARYSEALEEAASMGLTRQEIIRACENIIADRGQENYAAAKKVELVLDRMLSEGYTPNEALGNPDMRVGPNEAYLQAKEQIPGAVARDSWDYYRRQNELAVDAGEVTEEQLRQEFEERQTQMQPTTEPEDSPRRLLDVIRGNRDVISQNGVLMELSGNEFSDRSRRISDQVADFFKSIGNRVTRLGFGDVALTRRGAKNSIAHGIGRNKAITFAAVPAVIEDGQIIDEQSNWKERGYGSVTIGGRVKISGRDYDVGVVVRRDNSSTDTEGRYYLHEVVLTDEEGDPVSFWTGARQGNSGDTVSPSTTNIVQEEGENVNGELPEGQGAMSVGGAGPFATWQAQTPEGGFHPINQEAAAVTAGERGRAPTEVPTVNPQGRLTSKTASTLLNANITPNEFAVQMEDALANGQFSRMAYSDSRATARAEQDIQDKGFQGALTDWMADMRAGRFNKDLSAMGITLYNNAVNAGDAITAMDIASEMVSYGKALGQSLQAFNLINKMSPSGQLYAMSKQIENLDQQIRNRAKVNKETGLPDYEGIEIDPDLAQQFMEAETAEDRARIQDLIYRDIASKVPATWQDKFNSWRYLAMLGNPRTHFRNILGNLGFMPVRMMKNAVSGAIQGATGIEGRTRAPLNIANAEDRARLQAGWEDFKNVEPLIRQSSKYDDMEDAIDRYRTIFRAKPLEGLRQFNSEMLDREDMWFSHPAYAEALAEYLKANDISTSDFLSDTFDAERKQAAQEFAIREAQQATYRDMNAFSEFITRSGRLQNSENKVDRAIGYLVEGVLPFKKTPANIALRAVEYSPVGLVKALTYDLAQVQRGNMTAAEAIDHLSAGLVGTGLVAFGALLASQGLISGGGSGDDKQDDFNDLQGGQDYALNVGDYSFTLDWLAPEALPFFVGVELFNNVIDRKEAGDDVRPLEEVWDALGRIADPMLEMSMLQSLNDMIDDIRYSDNGFASLAVNALTSYLGQFLPTIGGQIERTMEDTRQTTYIDRDSWIPNSFQMLLGRWANKIPGVEFQQQDYIDAWGRTESTGDNPLIRALNNFLNPAYVSERQTSALESELQRLYDLGEGYEGVFPSRAQTSTKINDEYLTGEEYTNLQRTRGQTAYDILSGFVGTDAYNNMTDEQKAKFIDRVYTYASDMGKVAAGANLEDSDRWIRAASKAQEEVGMDPGKFVELYSYKSSIDNADDDADAGIKQGRWEDYVDSRTDLTDQQKQYVKDNIFFSTGHRADSGSYHKAKDAGFSDEEVQNVLTQKKAANTDGNTSYNSMELYTGILNTTDDPAEQEKYYNAWKNSDATKTWAEFSAAMGPVYQRTQAAKKVFDATVSSDHQTAFQSATAKYGTSSRYKTYQAIMSVEGATDAERKAMYDYISAQRAQGPWKASWSDMVANGGYPS